MDWMKTGWTKMNWIKSRFTVSVLGTLQSSMPVFDCHIFMYTNKIGAEFLRISSISFRWITILQSTRFIWISISILYFNLFEIEHKQQKNWREWSEWRKYFFVSETKATYIHNCQLFCERSDVSVSERAEQALPHYEAFTEGGNYEAFELWSFYWRWKFAVFCS